MSLPSQSRSLTDLLLIVALVVGTCLLIARDRGPAPELRFVTSVEHQQATAEITAVGAGLTQWIVDQITRRPEASGPGGACDLDVEDLPVVTAAELESLLVPDYLADVPATDPWGDPYEYRLADTLVGYPLVSIRTAAADGLFEGTVYPAGVTAGADDDLVWADFTWWRTAPTAGDPARQLHAAADLHHVGTAMFSWLIDQIAFGEPEAANPIPYQGPAVVDMDDYQVIDHATLSGLLSPQYMRCVPEHDPWGGAYDFRLNPNLLGSEVIAIRSAGRDTTFDGSTYPVGEFPGDDLDHDLVWADGSFVVFPSASYETLFADGFEQGLWGIWLASP